MQSSIKYPHTLQLPQTEYIPVAQLHTFISGHILLVLNVQSKRLQRLVFKDKK